MAIQEVNYLDGTNGPEWRGEEGERVYNDVLEAITDGTENGVSIATSGHARVPVPYVTKHRHDPYARCVSCGPWEPTGGDLYYWTARAVYTNRPKGFAYGSATGGGGTGGSAGGEPSHPQTPLDRKPRYKFRSLKLKKLRQVDLDGNVFRNGAGTLYETMMLDVNHFCVEVERNIPGFDYNFVTTAPDSCNSVAYAGGEKRRWKCLDLTADYEYQEECGGYYKVRGIFVKGNSEDILTTDVSKVAPATYVMQNGALVLVAPATTEGWWYEWKINAGMEYLDGNGNPKPLYDGAQRVSRPVPLTVDGTARLAPGATVNWRAFRVCRDLDHTVLGLFD